MQAMSDLEPLTIALIAWVTTFAGLVHLASTSVIGRIGGRVK